MESRDVAHKAGIPPTIADDLTSKKTQAEATGKSGGRTFRPIKAVKNLISFFNNLGESSAASKSKGPSSTPVATQNVNASIERTTKKAKKIAEKQLRTDGKKPVAVPPRPSKAVLKAHQQVAEKAFIENLKEESNPNAFEDKRKSLTPSPKRKGSVSATPRDLAKSIKGASTHHLKMTPVDMNALLQASKDRPLPPIPEGFAEQAPAPIPDEFLDRPLPPIPTEETSPAVAEAKAKAPLAPPPPPLAKVKAQAPLAPPPPPLAKAKASSPLAPPPPPPPTKAQASAPPPPPPPLKADDKSSEKTEARPSEKANMSEDGLDKAYSKILARRDSVDGRDEDEEMNEVDNDDGMDWERTEPSNSLPATAVANEAEKNEQKKTSSKRREAVLSELKESREKGAGGSFLDGIKAGKKLRNSAERELAAPAAKATEGKISLADAMQNAMKGKPIPGGGQEVEDDDNGAWDDDPDDQIGR